MIKPKEITHNERPIDADVYDSPNSNDSKECYEKNMAKSKRPPYLILLPIVLIVTLLGIVKYNSSLSTSKSRRLGDDSNDEDKIREETRTLATQLCTSDIISFERGRLMCEALCENDKEYTPCMILHNHQVVTLMSNKKRKKRSKKRNKRKKKKSRINEVTNLYQENMSESCTQNSLRILYHKRLCTQICMPSECCFNKGNCDPDPGCNFYAICGNLYN